MASQLRVDEIQSSITNTVSIGNTVSAPSVVVGNSFINSTSIGIGTTDTAGRNAGVGTAIGTLIFNSTTNSFEGFGPQGWKNVKTVEDFSATGGTEFTYNGKKIHVFTGDGTFTASGVPGSVEYVVVAGGGGGHNQRGGGGGSGGYRTGNSFPVSPGSYPITVGAGGANTSNGSDSIFSTITSTGGGAGGPLFSPQNGLAGGSGGGAGAEDGNTGTGGAGNTPPTSPPQGNPGGNSAGSGGSSGAGGGGGGAGSAGQNASAPITAGWGGIGIQLPATFQDPSNPYGAPGPSGVFWVAGGGGGGSFNGPGNNQGGGPGGPYAGGGEGGRSQDGTAGTTNTGGGGGGGGRTGGAAYNGGAGGSGIVMIAYPTT